MKKSKEQSLKADKLSFLSDFTKNCGKMEGIALSSPPPNHYLSFGNYVINKTLSGNYYKGIASGRLAALAGPAGAGKSFLGGNLIKEALTNKNQEWGVLVLDSENAIDDDYLENIGANALNNPLYNYRGISTISDAVNIVSKFIKSYKASNEDMPFLIYMDSVDQLRTDSEMEQYQSGDMKGDMGQHARQIKGMLSRFVADIKGTNIAMACVKQAYQEQDKMAAYQNPWKITPSFEFAFSQIAMITRLLLKNDDTKLIDGIRLQVKGYKTRFTKPYQKCVVEVPYDSGMDAYSGLFEAALSIGIVTKATTQSYDFAGNKFKKSEFNDFKDVILLKLLENETVSLNVPTDEYEEDTSEAKTAKEIQTERKTREPINNTEE